MRTVPRLRDVYSGICLTTKEKARKNLMLSRDMIFGVRRFILNVVTNVLEVAAEQC
jgi:hypothetical protein